MYPIESRHEKQPRIKLFSKPRGQSIFIAVAEQKAPGMRFLRNMGEGDIPQSRDTLSEIKVVIQNRKQEKQKAISNCSKDNKLCKNIKICK